MRNIEVRIYVKLEVKVSIEIILRNAPLPHPRHIQKITHSKMKIPGKNFLTHAKNFDPRKSRKSYDPCKK